MSQPMSTGLAGEGNLPPRGELPEWLVDRFMGPEERVLWWAGPCEPPWLEWGRDQKAYLIGMGFASFLLMPFVFAAFAVFGLTEIGVGFVLGGLFGLVALSVACGLEASADKRLWYVVTDRRLFLIKGQMMIQEHDLEFLRRFLTAWDQKNPGTLASLLDKEFDLSKRGRRITGQGDSAEQPTDIKTVLTVAGVLEEMRRLPPR